MNPQKTEKAKKKRTSKKDVLPSPVAIVAVMLLTLTVAFWVLPLFLALGGVFVINFGDGTLGLTVLVGFALMGVACVYLIVWLFIDTFMKLFPQFQKTKRKNDNLL